ncbi:tRNA1(Val) (adenine(37)-N6)-methyltransferase [Oceaniglobus trochenteri]|uniref:tRNA1(Val) (adenine(37)-N6)-methyltransferase n=1 Tax=Oceaniglobus trochenteri TaxID=2763260 RepID=UPI001D001092|nr:methyltransferase [Oceaniglobus trochenteri]
MTSTSGAEAPPFDDITQDAFLGGRLTVAQPARGYRAGIDAVLLAASVPAKPGQSVLELGCGVGVASLCLGARVSGLELSGLEVQPDYAELARRNGLANGMDLAVHTGDLMAMPAALRQQSFDHVIANPPYYHAPSRTASRDAGRETAHAEGASLAAWIDAATRRLRPNGMLSVIQRADRLRDLLAACDDRLGRLILRPIQARQGRPAQLILLTATKGGRTPLTLRNPLFLHEGDRHESDSESYTPLIRDVLRGGLPLI